MPERQSPPRPSHPTPTPPPRPAMPNPPTEPAANAAASPAAAGPAGPNTAYVESKDFTVNKVLAGAGAAATSAVMGSFFGAMGTVTGAAVGSIASTVVTQLYEVSLDRTKDTVTSKLKVRRGLTAKQQASPEPDQASAEVTMPIPRITDRDQPTEIFRPGDPATSLLGADGLTRQLGDSTSPTVKAGRPWVRWV